MPAGLVDAGQQDVFDADDIDAPGRELGRQSLTAGGAALGRHGDFRLVTRVHLASRSVRASLPMRRIWSNRHQL